MNEKYGFVVCAQPVIETKANSAVMMVFLFILILVLQSVLLVITSTRALVLASGGVEIIR